MLLLRVCIYCHVLFYESNTLFLYYIDETDYVGRTSELPFASGSVAGNTSCTEIDIVDDYAKESNESFIFAIYAEEDYAVHIYTFYSDIYIFDDDSMLCVYVSLFLCVCVDVIEIAIFYIYLLCFRCDC